MMLRKKLLILLINVICLVCGVIVVDLLLGYISNPTIIRYNNTKEKTNTKKAVPKHLLSPYFGWIETPGTILNDIVSQYRLSKQSEKDDDPDWLYIPCNNMGFTSEYDIPIVKEANDILILVLGGSVARWFALQTSEDFIKQLTQNSYFKNKNIILLNMAAGGYKQPQQLNLLNFLLINSTIPDIVINIDGFNEAALSYDNLFNGVSPIYPSFSHWANMSKGTVLTFEIRKAIKEFQISLENRDYFVSLYNKFWYSNILSYIYSKRIDYWNHKMVKNEIVYTKKITKSNSNINELIIKGPMPDISLDKITDIWVNSSKLINDICKKNGIKYFHYLQPTSFDPDNYKTFTKDELNFRGSIEDQWAQGVINLYPIFKLRAKELVSYGIIYKDLTKIFINNKETLYYDKCHFNQQGNEIMAKFIANHINEHILIP